MDRIARLWLLLALAGMAPLSGRCQSSSGCAPDVYPARILADGILQRRVQVNSPDVVDDNGVLATDGWNPGGTCVAKGNDASILTPFIVFNAACSQP